MYRILPKKVVFLAFGWLVLGIIWLFQALPNVLHLQLGSSTKLALAWLVLNILLFNPIWRFFWRKIPPLKRWIFPDLNGIWEVELFSNWPRQLQLLEAAASNESQLDMRHCPEANLAPLAPIHLEAVITQTWWSFEMHMYNPKGDTPIDRSDTISVDPFLGKGLQPPGICYFYEQVNSTDNVSDDNVFYGAARLTYDTRSDRLTGLAWTARMWPRAMNTAGPITFTRKKPVKGRKKNA
jgi:hypothetical protein